MHLTITHLTRYTYDQQVHFQPHLLYLRPRDNPLLKVGEFTFTFSPTARVNWMRDDFDNLPASAHFSDPGIVLEICSACQVETVDAQPFDFLLRGYAAAFPFDYEPLHRFNLSIYLTPPVQTTQEILRAWIHERMPKPPSETVAWLAALNWIIFDSITYARRDEPGIQSSLVTVRRGTGTCRDYAMLLIECARTLGIAARFVSGYLFDPADDGTGHGDMHAWVEVFLPGAGWRGLDPTHGIFCNSGYVPVAHAVVAESVNPIQGAIAGPASTMARLTTEVRVRRSDVAWSRE
jgi:transglutaminase-like putative cysteine protease